MPTEDVLKESEEMSIMSSEPPKDTIVKPKTKFFKFLNKKTILISSAGILGTLVVVGVLIFVLSKPKKQRVDISRKIIQNIQPMKMKDKSSKLRLMIKTAKSLYEEGKTQEALELYSQIAKYEEFLTFHNLGVADMKAKRYKSALKNFEKSISSGQNKCVSSINAAVVSLYLKKPKLFKHYIDLAKNYLPSVSRDPMYDYYYSLVMFYQNKYIESLSVLRNKDIDFYKDEQYKMTSTMLSSLNDNILSVEYLERQKNKDDLALGLMYLKLGDYEASLPYLKNAKNTDINNSSMALYMSYLKLGKINDAHSELKSIIDKSGNELSRKFPITLFLQDSLFNVNKAQANFKKNLNYLDELFYKLFLYFAPYKINNANKVINYIRKGSKSFYIDDVSYSRDTLAYGNKLSKLNSGMAKGIKLATNYKIRNANEIFKKLEDKFSFDSMLSYNLALTYAQLGHFGMANKYFKKSYSLNNDNKLSAILAVMSQRLSSRGDGEDTLNLLINRINNEPMISRENEFYESVVSYLRGILNGKYLNTSYKTDNSVLHIFYKMVLSSSVGSPKEEEILTKKLKTILGDNIVSNILYFYLQNKKSNRKELAQNAISFMKTNDVFLDILYYGPMIAKEMYIGMANISGTGYLVRDILRERIIVETYDVRGVMQSLAFIDIYLNFFEEAFSIYNTLIDDFKESDPNTLFLASVAAIGAGKHANAIALLELTVLNKSLINNEARFALAMLYQEDENLKAANLHLEQLRSNDFTSKYFDFKLKEQTR